MTCDNNTVFAHMMNILPPLCQIKIKECLKKTITDEKSINEIRLRLGRNVSLSIGKNNLVIDHIMTESDIKSTLHQLCAGSVYAFQKTIKQGYIPSDFGGRVGVVGNVTNDDYDIAVESINSINIRIPHHIRGISGKIYDLFLNTRKGIIVYAPPGVGKTTFLRDLAIELSRGDKAIRVCLVDSRHELDNGQIPSDCLIDTLAGYPKDLGIEIATRTMSCDVIICDEIGGGEVSAIRQSLFCGVPVIAAAHAFDFTELKAREGIGLLLSEGAFSHAVGLRRECGGTSFIFNIIKTEGI